MSAVCDLEAHFSHCYLNALREREIWRWKLQSTTIISLPHHYLYHLILDGTLCVGLVLCSLQRVTSAIQSCSQVHYNQICSISYILAGKIRTLLLMLCWNIPCYFTFHLQMSLSFTWVSPTYICFELAFDVVCQWNVHIPFIVFYLLVNDVF